MSETKLQYDSLGQYEIVDYLASGGYGSVYKAKDLDTGKTVAVKVLDTGSGREKAERRKRFVEEIEALRRFRHPNIVEVYQDDSKGEPLWYAMEYLAGPSLKEVMREEVPLYRKVGILRQIADALGCIHEKGYVHRDVKPDNIMFRTMDYGAPVLFDMGLVHNPLSGYTLAQNQILGTPLYLSPEQCSGGQGYTQTDVWAVGVILYQWLGKTHPIGTLAKSGSAASLSRIEIEQAVVHEPVEPLESLLLKGSTAPLDSVMPGMGYLAELCDHALAKDVQKRYLNGKLLAAALEDWGRQSHKRFCDLAERVEERGDLDAAIAYLEKAYLLFVEQPVVDRLKRLWDRKLGKDTRLVPKPDWEKIQKERQTKGQEATLCETRTIAHPQLSANQEVYVVYEKKDRGRVPSGFTYLREATYSCGGQTHTVREYRHDKTGGG
jgi:serine/threonine protein kinase